MEGGAGRLAARVIVNRLWQHHFGLGIVRTPSDVGLQGDRPSHAELLDWLAGELIRNGWHLKPIHRLIMNSAAYRRGVRFDPAAAKADPEDRLLWRRQPLRLEAEAVRDSLLAVSGCLNSQMYGPGVHPRVHPDAIYKTESKYGELWPANVTDGPATWRRSVYVFVKRSNPMPFIQVFDQPETVSSCGQRAVSTVAPQALALMNDQFAREQAAHFAGRARSEGGADRSAQIKRAYALALGRPPRPTELDRSLAFLGRQDRHYRRGNAPLRIGDPDPGLTDFCQALMSLNEFVYVD